MGSNEQLQEQVDRLTHLINDIGHDESPSTQLNRMTLERLRMRVANQMATESSELNLRFQDEFHRNEMPARKLASILSSLADAVAHSVNLKRTKPYVGQLPESFRALVDFRLVAISPGSVRVLLRTPQPSAQHPGEISMRASRETEQAIISSVDEIIDILDVANNQEQIENQALLAGMLRRIGPDASRNIARLSKVISEDEYSVDLLWKSDAAVEASRRARFGPTQARQLREIIGRQDAEVAEKVLIGTLVTASVVRPMFDLMVDGQRITGRVTEELQRELRQFFDRRVRAYIRETTSSSPVTNQESRKVELYRLELLDESGDD